MVKGMSRQVIVVPSPDPDLFEQAIFILRQDAVGRKGVSDRELLRQAKQAAGAYLAPKKRKRKLKEPVWAVLGGLAVGMAWLLCGII